MTGLFSADVVATFFQVVLIDIVLAGDNAMLIGLAAADLPDRQRNKAIATGIVAAALLRIIFASATTWLLAVPGIILAGGAVLLWVCWRMWRELRTSPESAEPSLQLAKDQRTKQPAIRRKTFAQATSQIVIADVSMSLDNVLAVAGAAHKHPAVLVFALVLSVALMGVAATVVTRLLQRFRWLAYLGLAVILYVAIEMIARGIIEVRTVAT